MKVKFVAGEEFWLDVFKQTKLYKKREKINRLFVSLVMGAVFFAGSIIPYFIAEYKYIAIAIGVFFTIIGLFFGYTSSKGLYDIALRNIISKKFNREATVFLECEITQKFLVANFITNETEPENMRFPWEMIDKIIVGEYSIYYNFIEEQKFTKDEKLLVAFQSFPIPLTAFHSAEEKAEFIELSEKYLYGKDKQ